MACGEAAKLPEVVSSSDCITLLDAATVCEWGQKTDAVVLGTITAMRGDETIVSFLDGTSGSADECSSWVETALHLVLTVDEVLLGDAPPEVTISVGAEHFNRWAPAPRFQDDDPTTVIWPNGLQVGQSLGVGIYTTDGDVWALHSRVFSVEDAIVSFQPGETCGAEPNYQGAEADFRAQLNDCTRDAVANDELNVEFSNFSTAVFAYCGGGR